MPSNPINKTWQDYIASEIPQISHIIEKHDYFLDDNQPHIKGERFLMQSVTTESGKKLILYGHNLAGKKVVIKATRDFAGKTEILNERRSRNLLHKIDFAYDTFHSPHELCLLEKNGFIIIITEFIEQTSTFLERPIEEQFAFALRALKAQEQTRATTGKHISKIKEVFNYRTSENYLNLHTGFLNFIKNSETSNKIIELVTQNQEIIRNSMERIEQYCGFLTHTDFVPHNFRIRNDILYLLDFSSLQFGNKHESWARFLNFMTLYNPELENLLINYVEQNRSTEERESLQLMRLFRLSEIITYYVKNVAKSEGALFELNQHRVKFWSDVLEAEQKNTRVSREIVKEYQNTRDNLRSQEEKERQVGLH